MRFRLSTFQMIKYQNTYKYTRCNVQLKQQTLIQAEEETSHMSTCSLVNYTQRQQLTLVKQLLTMPEMTCVLSSLQKQV